MFIINNPGSYLKWSWYGLTCNICSLSWCNIIYNHISSGILKVILWQLTHSMWKASLIWYMELGLRALLIFKLCRRYTIYAWNIWINQMWESLSHSTWEQTQAFLVLFLCCLKSIQLPLSWEALVMPLTVNPHRPSRAIR